jgi:hypothetical protein
LWTIHWVFKLWLLYLSVQDFLFGFLKQFFKNILYFFLRLSVSLLRLSSFFFHLFYSCLYLLIDVFMTEALKPLWSNSSISIILASTNCLF